jgi:hypothetical protein
MWPFLPKKCNCPTTPTNPNTNCNHNGLYAKDLVYQGVDIPCAEIYSGMDMSEVLQRLDYYVCGIGFTQQVLDIIQENPQEFNDFIVLVNGAINCETINACGPVPTTTTTSTTEVIVTTTTSTSDSNTTTTTTTNQLTTTTTTTNLITTTTTTVLEPTTTTTTTEIILTESLISSVSNMTDACPETVDTTCYVSNVGGLPGLQVVTTASVVYLDSLGTTTFIGDGDYYKIQVSGSSLFTSSTVDSFGVVGTIVSICP